MKRKEKVDFSMLIYALMFVIIAGLMLFFMCYDPNKNQKVSQSDKQTSKQEKVVTSISKQEVAQPTIGKNYSSFEKYSYIYSYIIKVQGSIKNFVFKMPIPIDESERQYILNSRTSIKPTKTYFDGTNQIAEFNFESLSNQTISIDIEGSTQVRTYDLKTAKSINKNPSPEKNLERYLKPEQYIESSDNAIKAAANRIKGETKEEIIQNIYKFTQKHLTYKHIPGISGAKRALQERVGECSEYSSLMVALCRAKNIPARVVSGNIARESNTKHNWVEVYFDEYGWVTFDPTIMPTLVNVYQNGKLVRQEKRLDSTSASAKYISSGKNLFSPYTAKYGHDTNNTGKAFITERIKIEKM